MVANKYDIESAAAFCGVESFNFVPLIHRIVVEIPPAKETSGKIILVDSMKDREHLAEHIGKVSEVGDKAFVGFNASVKPEVGNWVFFKAHAGEIFYRKDTMYRLMNDEDVLAILEVKNK